MVGLLGSLVQLEKAGLLELILYLSGVSGSTWCMASLYQEPDWSTKLEAVKDKIIKRLSGPKVSWTDALAKLKKYYYEKDIFSLTDFWAATVVTTFVKEDLITSTMTTECGVGEWTSEEVVTPEEKKFCLEVKSDIEKKAGATFETYIPLSFRTQIVAGKNHLVKVYVGVDKCFHAMISQALPCNGGKLTVNGVQHPKTASEPLIPFGR